MLLYISNQNIWCYLCFIYLEFFEGMHLTSLTIRAVQHDLKKHLLLEWKQENLTIRHKGINIVTTMQNLQKNHFRSQHFFV